MSMRLFPGRVSLRRRPGAQARQALVLGLCCLTGGQAWALNEVALNCSFGNGKGLPWRVVNELTSGTAKGTVLFARPVSLFLNYKPQASQEAHELVIGGNWSGVGFPGPYGTVASDVKGIGYRISVDAQDGVKRVIPVDNQPHALDKRVTSFSGSTTSDYLQELVLTVDPGELPAGDLKVTSVSGSATLNLWAVDRLKGEASIGSVLAVPADNYPTGVCRKPYSPIPKKCKVEVGREINVKLGSVALKNFPRVNDTSTERSFDISLSECAALAKPEIAFRDKYVSAQQADPTILSLKSGGAAGFGIVVKNGLDQQRIRFDGTPYPMRRVGDSADLPLSAAYIRIGAEGELKAGVADGAAEFTFTFP